MASAGLASLLCLVGSASAQPPERSVTVGGSGDLLLHLRVIAAAAGSWERVLGPLAGLAVPTEVSFANLETPLSMDRPPSSGEPPVLGAPPEVAAALARAGLDVLSLANNHSYDQYATGMAQTVEAVRAAGIGTVGAGSDRAAALAPFLVERDGVRVAFVALTERVNGGPGARQPVAAIARWTDDAEIDAALARAREHADVLVVSIHWSHDFWREPTAGQRARARRLIDAGADVILGHGPHVLHRVERLASPRGEAVCAYSLGNLLSNQGMRYRAGRTRYPGAHVATWLPETRDGVWLRASVAVREGRVRIARLEGVPLFTLNNYVARLGEPGASEDIRIARLAELDDAVLRDERRRAIAAALGPEVTLVD